MVNLSTIKSEADYAAVLEEIEKLIDADPALNTPEADRLDLLTLVANDYEAKEFPTELPDAVEAIKFRMEQQGLSRKDLEPMIGTRARVAEVMNRRRSLSIDMIRRLHDQLGISAEVLIRPTREDEAA
jgi:HTH-type transcriptional regulator/antitoxin HigA